MKFGAKVGRLWKEYDKREAAKTKNKTKHKTTQNTKRSQSTNHEREREREKQKKGDFVELKSFASVPVTQYTT